MKSTSTDRIQPVIHPVADVRIPEAAFSSLPNGIPVYLIEAGTEDVLRIEFTFHAGQVRETLPLLASTVNMMLAEGSDIHTAEDINRMLDFHGAYMNPYSEKDRAGIVFFFLTRHQAKMFELAKEIIFRPVFPEKELEALMNKRLRWYLNAREKVQNLASDLFYESVFGSGHPYGYSIKESDFTQVNRSHVAGFHTEFYDPVNMAIIVSGKLNESTLDLLHDYFGGLACGRVQTSDRPLMTSGASRKGVFLLKKGALQNSIRIGSRSVNKRDPVYTGLKVLNTVLGGYFGSRLMRNIREEKGYTYGISSSITSLDLSGFKVISTDVGTKHSSNAKKEIYREIERLQTEKIPVAELETVRNYMSGEMLRMFDGPFALAESFRSAWEFGLDNSYFHRLARTIRTITPDEIKSLAATYYNIDDLFEITAGEQE